MAHNRNRVSVIMPCYNDGAYILESIESVRKQTWNNKELIIVDDGSDDPDTIRILHNLKEPWITLVKGEHKGPAAARNIGIQKATGEFILPLDSDDTIEDNYIERAAEILAKRKEVGIVYCHADLFGESQGKWDLPDYSLRTEMLDNCIFVTSMFRKEQWEKVGGFCEDFKAGMEDYDFWLSIIGLGYDVIQLEETLFHYRIKKTSRTSDFMSDYQSVQDTYVILYDRHRELIAQNIDDYCKDLRRCLIDYIYHLRKSEQINQDPTIAYWRSVMELKPEKLKCFEKWLEFKGKIKKLMGKR